LADWRSVAIGRPVHPDDDWRPVRRQGTAEADVFELNVAPERELVAFDAEGFARGYLARGKKGAVDEVQEVVLARPATIEVAPRPGASLRSVRIFFVRPKPGAAPPGGAQAFIQQTRHGSSADGRLDLARARHSFPRAAQLADLSSEQGPVVYRRAPPDSVVWVEAVDSAGYRAQLAVNTGAPGSTVTAELRWRLEVEGVIEIADSSGAPMPGIQVTVVEHLEGRRRGMATAISNVRGEVPVAGMVAWGDYKATISDGVSSHAMLLPESLIDGTDPRWRFEFRRGRSRPVSARVQRSDGGSIEGVVVAFCVVNGATQTRLTDAEGVARADVPAGRTILALAMLPTQAAPAAQEKVPESGEVDLHLPVRPPEVRLHIEMLRAGGFVDLQLLRGERVVKKIRVYVSEKGEATFDRVEPGPYRVRAECEGAVSEVKTKVVAGSAAHVHLRVGS
ncbi:MAG: hypothetical protein ACYTEG_13695, partial [Planctomycetota bacterium]